ncbi:MAG: ABC transporter permease [Thermoanaerobaculum sp.]|nr:ABC transporter permease [Thermoanaerobaculum sp.]
MIRRVLALARKEVFHLLRDWRTLTALLVMPAVLLLIYGFALSFDIQHVRLGVVDQDQTPLSRQFIRRLEAGTTFDVVRRSTDLRQAVSWLDRFHVQAVYLIPRGFQKSLVAGQPVPVGFLVDGSDSRTASTVLAYGELQASLYLPPRSSPRQLGPIQAAPVVWYNPSLKSSHFLVPGLVALILMVTSVVATALAVVREKERGTLETLRVTPLRPLELVVGKTLPYLFLGLGAATLELGVAHVSFEVPLRGSALWLLVVTLLFLLGGLGWGLLLSTVAETQQVAFQLALLSTLLPTLLLSGFIFPISSMPPAIQAVTTFIPARYFLVALRSIVLKGAGPELWWREAVSLAAFAAVVLALAVWRSRRSF